MTAQTKASGSRQASSAILAVPTNPITSVSINTIFVVARSTTVITYHKSSRTDVYI